QECRKGSCRRSLNLFIKNTVLKKKDTRPSLAPVIMDTYCTMKRTQIQILEVRWCSWMLHQSITVIQPMLRVLFHPPGDLQPNKKQFMTLFTRPRKKFSNFAKKEQHLIQYKRDQRKW